MKKIFNKKNNYWSINEGFDPRFCHAEEKVLFEFVKNVHFFPVLVYGYSFILCGLQFSNRPNINDFNCCNSYSLIISEPRTQIASKWQYYIANPSKNIEKLSHLIIFMYFFGHNISIFNKIPGELLILSWMDIVMEL